MTASVTHHKVVTTPDDGTSEVGSDEWNAGHDISITAADIGASATGHDHDAAYDAIGAAAGAETAAESYADGAVGAHTGDTSSAHAASAVAVTPVGAVAATDVQAAIQELDTEKSGTGHNHSGTYDPAGTASTAVGTHESDTTAVHGFTDTANVARIAGEISGTGASPTIAASHSGSTHAATQAAAESTAAGALSTHESDKTSVHGFADTDNVARIAGEITGTGASPTIAATHSGSAHHAAITIGTDVEHSLSGQVLSGVAATTSQIGHAKVGADTPTTQAFGDSAVVGVGDGAANSLHKHAMPATPTTIANDTAWAAKGDLIVASANDAAAVLTAPTTRAQRLSADAAGNVSWKPMQAGPSGVRFSDDFAGYNTGFGVAGGAAPMIGSTQASMTGTASTIAFNPIVNAGNHPGIISMGTGSTSTGRVALSLVNAGGIIFGNGRCRMGAWVYIPVLSISSQRFEVTVGFADGFSDATIVDGCSFNYLDTINSGAWSVTTVANSVSTLTHQVTTSTTANATTWYLLEVEVNAAGTSVDYLINGTVVVTHSANIPTGAGRETGAYISILKSVGGTTQLLYCDAYYVELDFTTAR